MKFVRLLVISGFSFACVTALPDEDVPPPPTPAPQVKDVQQPKYGPTRVRMLCEFGCPATMPFLNIMRMPQPDVQASTPDAVPSIPDATTDIIDGVSSKDTCGDAYEFSVCCGDDVCQTQESPFFCPGDCL